MIVDIVIIIAVVGIFLLTVLCFFNVNKESKKEYETRQTYHKCILKRAIKMPRPIGLLKVGKDAICSYDENTGLYMLLFQQNGCSITSRFDVDFFNEYFKIIKEDETI